MRDWLDYTNTAIQLSVLGGLIWYAFETLKIRKSAQAQTGVSQLQADQTKKLIDLQSAIENERHRVSLFLPIKCTSQHGSSNATLELMNLSPFGIWLEILTVHISPNKAKPVPLEQKLMPGDTFKFELLGQIIYLTEINGGQRATTAVWVSVKYWANDKFATIETEHYEMTVGSGLVENFHLERGKALSV